MKVTTVEKHEGILETYINDKFIGDIREININKWKIYPNFEPNYRTSHKVIVIYPNWPNAQRELLNLYEELQEIVETDDCENLFGLFDD